MSNLTVAPHERGVIRLFTLDMRAEEAKFLREPGAADQVLGVDGLDRGQIDVFPVSDLEDLGLYGYLHEGGGVSEDQLNRTMLDAIEGWVMAVRSAAFHGKAAKLNPDPRVRLLGLYTEEATNWSGGMIEAESAKPFSAPQNPVENNAPRRIGSALLAVIALLIVGGALWLIL
ncbi:MULTISPECIES: hypothetical protein [unclassified Ruegeria]|uniref:hypothetical protein n=1 Tax=unclassified Ruegeria TaxID=2625375 RepID=UPI001ADB6CB8|nr:MULTISPECIES: hypothetical protein [unclassified Ruegeria]MBO9411616.1 hypothetical protein [Ruegeria sp. R8_1]MBO9415822.1 hypothetical protein [Ruegeria sp. R8_2]